MLEVLQLAFRLPRSRRSRPWSTSTSLLTRLYGATELHNEFMGANYDNESVMILVNIRSHAQMIYSISMIAVVCLCLWPLEDSVEAFNGHT